MSGVAAASYNTARVLRRLRQQPGLSRVEIADQLGLNRSTVTNIVNDLLARTLVQAVAESDASPNGGRKKTQLAINAGYGCAGGVQVHADYVRVVLVDLMGRLLYQHVLPGPVGQRNLHRRLLEACAHLARRAGQVGVRLLGIGCGLPGIVDPYRGTLLRSIPLGVQGEEPIVKRLEPVLGRPLLLGNDAHCCCWGELVGARDPATSFLFILGEWRRAPGQVGALLASIGVGVVLNRTVHHGRRYSAGEFRSVEWQAPSANQFSLRDEQIAAARTDPAQHRAMLRELARNAAMLVYMLNLDRLYLGGFFADQDVETRAIFAEEIQRRGTFPPSSACEVAFSSHGQHAVAYGAAGLILGHAFGTTAASSGAWIDAGQQARLALLF